MLVTLDVQNSVCVLHIFWGYMERTNIIDLPLHFILKQMNGALSSQIKCTMAVEPSEYSVSFVYYLCSIEKY